MLCFRGSARCPAPVASGKSPSYVFLGMINQIVIINIRSPSIIIQVKNSISNCEPRFVFLCCQILFHSSSDCISIPPSRNFRRQTIQLPNFDKAIPRRVKAYLFRCLQSCVALARVSGAGVRVEARSRTKIRSGSG